MIYIHRGLGWKFRATFVMLLEIYKRTLFGERVKAHFQDDIKSLKSEKQACDSIWDICNKVESLFIAKNGGRRRWLITHETTLQCILRSDGVVAV